MVKTYGLTHISLAVRDPGRSLRFYRQVFGVEEVYRDANSIQARTPGSHDVLAFERNASSAGRGEGVAHFGFRLIKPEDIETAVQEVERAGGTVARRGEFSPGLPYAYVNDPDGYEIEIWYE